MLVFSGRRQSNKHVHGFCFEANLGPHDRRWTPCFRIFILVLFSSLSVEHELGDILSWALRSLGMGLLYLELHPAADDDATLEESRRSGDLEGSWLLLELELDLMLLDRSTLLICCRSNLSICLSSPGVHPDENHSTRSHLIVDVLRHS